jgi:hypothetical protein
MAAALAAAPLAARAHVGAVSVVDVRVEAAAIAVEVTVPADDLAAQVGLAGGLALSADGRPLAAEAASQGPAPVPGDARSLRLSRRYPVAAAPALITVEPRGFARDPQHQLLVNVHERGALARQVILDRERPRLEHYLGSRAGQWARARALAGGGVGYTWGALPVWLFLGGLMLVGRGRRRLALVMGVFAGAQALGAWLAALGLVRPPPSLVEPAIAFGILFVGADNLLARGGGGRDLGPWIAGGFGLFHGFAIAGRGGGLAFHLGVVAAEVLGVGLMVAALVGLRAALRGRQRGEAGGVAARAALAGSLAVLGAGVFWFVERMFLSGGS